LCVCALSKEFFSFFLFFFNLFLNFFLLFSLQKTMIRSLTHHTSCFKCQRIFTLPFLVNPYATIYYCRECQHKTTDPMMCKKCYSLHEVRFAYSRTCDKCKEELNIACNIPHVCPLSRFHRFFWNMMINCFYVCTCEHG